MSDATKALPPLEAPWGYTQKGAVFCLFEQCPEGIKSQLRRQSGSKCSDEKFRYGVTVYENNEARVYRNEKGKQNNSSAEVAAAVRDQTVMLQAILAEQKTHTKLLQRIADIMEARR